MSFSGSNNTLKKLLPCLARIDKDRLREEWQEAVQVECDGFPVSENEMRIQAATLLRIAIGWLMYTQAIDRYLIRDRVPRIHPCDRSGATA
jgi:hypothetical protein